MTTLSQMITELAAVLPEPGSLPSGTPRYPNLWLHMRGADGEPGNVHARNVLRQATGIVDDLPESQNLEGADESGRRRRLEPIELPDASRSHDHQLHMRIYLRGLGGAQRVRACGEVLWRVGVSVHYEVDRPRSLHPYVDECPRCGCVGEHDQWWGAEIHEKNVWVHDPLGLELATHGTVGGRQVSEVAGLLSEGNLAQDYAVLDSSDLADHKIEAAQVGLLISEMNHGVAS